MMRPLLRLEQGTCKQTCVYERAYLLYVFTQLSSGRRTPHKQTRRSTPEIQLGIPRASSLRLVE
jgi:hypothetical protein